MADLLYVDLAYCTVCDRYFPGSDARRHHIQVSSNHPKCETCNRRFANKNSLRNHFVVSPRHHWCAVCERDFRTPAGLRVHIEYAAVHRDDTDDDSDDEEIDDSSEGWEDELGRTIFPDDSSDEGNEEDTESVDYWTDDDVEEFEEEQDAYDGVAPVPLPPPGGLENQSIATSSLSDESDTAPHGNTQAGEVDGKAIVPPTGLFITCPLCLEAPSESSATKCGHLFCTTCIKQALSQKRMCPVCRDFAVPRDLRRIYLPSR